MPSSRKGSDSSQTIGNKIKASNANGQHNTNRMHQLTNRIRAFIRLSFQFFVQRQLLVAIGPPTLIFRRLSDYLADHDPQRRQCSNDFGDMRPHRVNHLSMLLLFKIFLRHVKRLATGAAQQHERSQQSNPMSAAGNFCGHGYLTLLNRVAGATLPFQARAVK
jgi:hypothetical protein